MASGKVRTRFAPSPTGPLHIGGVRTALYNYFFARRHGGDFILRIEDTDSGRYVPGAEEYIFESFDWCGIKFDEGVREGGKHSPYRQSERREIYLDYALQLVESGNAYYAFDTPEALDKLRCESEKRGEAFSYNHSIRERMDTSLRLDEAQTKERLEGGSQWVIRFKIPANEDIVMNDIIRGEVVVNSSILDDKVLYKSSDSLPTYHLANVVDDHLMEISHVIRGEEWLPSLPLHYLLYRAFGWNDSRPQFAHLPLLLKPEGKGKLSKRDGQRMGFPVFPLQWTDPTTGEVCTGYREAGYFPEAFVNMLALLGWNPGTEEEIFSMQEMTDLFSLEKAGKSGARFDPQKALWFNAQYMHKRSDSELAGYLMPVLKGHGIEAEPEKVEKIISLVKPRATLLGDLWELSSFFFERPQEYDSGAVKKYWKGDNPLYLTRLRDFIHSLPQLGKDGMKESVHDWITAGQYPMGQVMNTFRLAVVGASKGPDMFDIYEVLGREEILLRMDRAAEILGRANIDV